jgi:hypothetical protein
MKSHNKKTLQIMKPAWKMGTVHFLGMALFLSTGFLVGALAGNQDARSSADRVRFDYAMVEKGIAWLKLAKSGADDNKLREHFMQEVAPTRGCQAIIHHWERFRKWDVEEFYNFILTALELLPSDEPLKNEDGTPTALGRRRRFWRDALNNIERLEQDLEALKRTDLNESIATARQYLPGEAVLQADFCFVLFGHSSAFSVGEENGFDVLQLQRREGKIDIEAVTQLLAHELHHTGFDFLIKTNLKDVSHPENLLLLGILAAEGMPTYYIDRPWFLIPRYLKTDDPMLQQYARDWEQHSARIKQLYLEAEEDIRLNLEGKLDQAEIIQKWMAGVKGPAYVLGSDMFSVIDGYLGRSVALKVAADYRKFLLYYNYGAEKARQAGFRLHVFDEKLVQRVTRYGN